MVGSMPIRRWASNPRANTRVEPPIDPVGGPTERTNTDMKTPMKLFATFVTTVLLLGTQAGAQDINAKGGLLGKRYVGADFTYADYKSEAFDDAQSGTAIFNTP